MNRIFVIWNECQWMQSPIMTTLFLCIQNAYVASLSALLVESVCTHLVYGSRQQYQLGCGVSREGKNNIFWICMSSWADFNHGLVVRPQGSQGCQKIHKNILQINLLSYCANIQPILKKLQKTSRSHQKQLIFGRTS